MAMMDMDWRKGSGKDTANYFLGPDYYLDGGAESYYRGKETADLGIKNALVTKENFTALLSNRRPDGSRITRRDNPNRRAAIEIVVSEPKSVSAMYALHDKRILAAHQAAVDQLMNRIQDLGAYRRLRAGGKDESVWTGNLVWAPFTHTLGRPTKGKNELLSTTSLSDPQLHTHIIVPNFTRDPVDGKWYALDGKHILENSDYYRAFYRAAMVNQLRMLGYQLDIKDGNYEIAGVGKDINDLFSNRTAQINETAEKYGITREDTKSKLGRMTRERKSDRFDWEQLQELWRGRLTPEQQQRLLDVYTAALNRGRYQYAEFEPRMYAEKYVGQAMERLTAKDTYTSELKVISLALKTGLGRTTHEHIEKHISKMVEDRQWIRQKDQPHKLSTKAALLKDIEVKNLWKKWLGMHEPLAGRDYYTVKAPGKPHLEALNKLYGSRDRFTSMRGSIGRNPAVGRAAIDLNAGLVNDPSNPPEERIWFVTESIGDSDRLDLMKLAEERDARVVFWGDKTKNRIEEDMNLEPVTLYDTKKPKQKQSKRLKQAVLTHIRSQQNERSMGEVSKSSDKPSRYSEAGRAM